MNHTEQPVEGSTLFIQIKISISKMTMCIVTFTTRLYQTWHKYHLGEAMLDLLIAYLPIMIVAWFLFSSGNSPVLLLARSDLMLLTAVLFTEGFTTARRSVDIHPFFSITGLSATVLLAGMALPYEVAVHNGNEPEAVINFVHLWDYQVSQIFWAVAGMGYGLWARILIYRSLDDEKKVDKEYPTDKAIEFYDLVAADYNNEYQSNVQVQETYRAIENEIGEIFISKSGEKVKVLDIGGGAGLLTRSYRTRNDLDWTHCEPSSGMMKQFDDSFKTAALNPKRELATIEQVVKNLAGEKFDIILLSFVLSSLDRFPDFSSLKPLLNETGILIVADVNVNLTGGEDDNGKGGSLLSITCKNGNGETLGLRLTQLDILGLITDLTNAGFAIKKTPILIMMKDSLNRHSFVAVFNAA